MNNIQLGLGLWQGFYGESDSEALLRSADRISLRWYDAEGNWILTPEEREKQRAEQERRRVERVAEQLR
jgi:hypothetical protein